MPENIGYRFQPGADMTGRPQQGQARPQGLSPQQAVRLLQLRVPERPAGAGAVAPQGLLQAQGGGGMSALAAIIRALMGGQMMGGRFGGMQPPIPRVVPGLQSPDPTGRPGPVPMPDVQGLDVEEIMSRFKDMVPGGGFTGGMYGGAPAPQPMGGPASAPAIKPIGGGWGQSGVKPGFVEGPPPLY